MQEHQGYCTGDQRDRSGNRGGNQRGVGDPAGRTGRSAIRTPAVVADAKMARARFAQLNKDPKTARLEKRLAELEPRLRKSSDPEDLQAISLQQREAFYRCE